MEELTELIRYLGYLEQKAQPPLPFLFHGCLAPAPESIRARGLRFTGSEPCLTYHPATAMLKYANPVRCSRNFHSGRARELIRAFGNAGEAAAYYDDQPDCGAMLIFSTENTGSVQASSGHLVEGRDAVSGGITKWMYCHVSPGSGSGTLPASSLTGMIRPSGELAEYLFRAGDAQNTADGWEKFGEALLPLLQDRDRAWLRCDIREAAYGIARCAATAGLLDYLRKITLSAASLNKKLLKTDYPPAVEEFPAPFAEDLLERIAAVKSMRCRDPWMEEVRRTFLSLLR